LARGLPKARTENSTREKKMQEFRLLIDGKMVPGDMTMPVVNPATEAVISECARASGRQLDEAVAAAKAAFPAWSARPIADRRAIVTKIAEVIEANIDGLARLLTAEQGKPLPDAMGETRIMASYYRHAGTLDLSTQILEETGERRIELHRRPLGVVAAITPWNYPLSISALKLPLALIAGNTVVLKPAPTTPLSTLYFAELIADIVPAGVVNVIADSNDLGAALTSHPDIRKISFTGSTATGRKVMAVASDALKRLTLELGGNDAAIVLDDADPKTIAPKVFQAAFQNAGQVCFAVKRVFVHESIYDAVCDEMAELAKALPVDDGMKQGAKIGPVQNRAQYERVLSIIEDAKGKGKVIAGGAAMDRAGYFIEPTIVRDIKEGARLVDEEQFGPVLPLIKFSDIDEVVRRANDTQFGLGASIWSSNSDRAYDVARRMESGTVWVNKHLELPMNVPIGGAKQSGMGVEKDHWGLEEFTQIQVINQRLGAL
jgi:acyl-CoA reductase-like NAD-dependent aldehyde dehydrogenase